MGKFYITGLQSTSHNISGVIIRVKMPWVMKALYFTNGHVVEISQNADRSTHTHLEQYDEMWYNTGYCNGAYPSIYQSYLDGRVLS